MLLDAAWSLFEDQLFAASSTSQLFNPYRDHDDALDRPGAAALRRENLRAYLAAYEQRPPVFLLAEAPGPWGCRFSGVPLVSEAQLADAAFPLGGQPTSRQEEPHGEYSASIYWRTLQPFFPRFFTWNSLPLHPHRPGEPLTIRTPRAAELKAWAGLVAGLLDVLQPQVCVAIGRKAEYTYRQIGQEATYVRHPSQGGAKLFAAGVRDVMGDVGLAASS